MPANSRGTRQSRLHKGRMDFSLATFFLSPLPLPPLWKFLFPPSSSWNENICDFGESHFPWAEGLLKCDRVERFGLQVWRDRGERAFDVISGFLFSYGSCAERMIIERLLKVSRDTLALVWQTRYAENVEEKNWKENYDWRGKGL